MPVRYGIDDTYTSSRFDVQFDGMTEAGPIQSVDGLSFKYEEPKAATSGGRAADSEPGRLIRAPDVTITRFYGTDNYFYEWMDNCAPGKALDARTGSVYLLNRAGENVGGWDLYGCFPKSWSVSDLDAGVDDPMIETVVLATEHVVRWL